MDDRAQEIDRYVEAFEQARSANSVSDLLSFAPPADHPLHLPVLREIVRVDLEFGWEEGRPRSLDDYRTALPSVFADGHGNDIAFEEYRLRLQAGDNPRIEDYRDRGFDVTGWPTRAATATIEIPSEGRTLRAISMHAAGTSGYTGDLRSLLHERLKFVAIGCAAIPAYFGLLVVLSPSQKVAFSLDNPYLIAFNWFACAVSTLVVAALWWVQHWTLAKLRFVEVLLFGLTLAEMSLSLFSDLFLDRELREPFTQGEHALFHYGSSWSLPFALLIVSYGTLIPSSWRRCIVMVAVMAGVPLGIAVAGTMWEGVFNRIYIDAFLVQMAIWLIAACAIAIYGARRIAMLQREAFEARRLGQYQLRERIAVGGMGEVYRAEHVLLRRPCALKLIRAEFANDPEIRRRFEHEVQMTATLTHPNTVQVFDYGSTRDGTFYYVMEYLPGLNLEQVVTKEGPLKPERIVHIMRQVCGSLREAHAAGLIHRDLKPSNVILGERGGMEDVAKLLDFGLVLLADRADFSSIAGSPLFMSPEQGTGRADLDERSDIYGLGALMYYLATGRPPFVRDSITAVLAANRQDPVVPPSHIQTNVPKSLEDAILGCLEKDPAKRYSSVEALLNALNRPLN
ncbi:MAG: serine/threonine-protein kinase [Gemmataceae bacterium]